MLREMQPKSYKGTTRTFSDNVLNVVDDLEAAKAFFIELVLKLEGETTVEGPLGGSLIGLKDVSSGDMSTALHYRQSILELLRDIATLEAGAGPVELVCGWFDDLYLPAESSQHPRSEAWSRNLQKWQQCFSGSELAALSSFNEVFESVQKKLATDPSAFASDPNWHRVSEAATEALRAFSERPV